MTQRTSMLTAEDIAVKFGLCYVTALKFIRKALKYQKDGCKYLVDKKELMDFLNKDVSIEISLKG